MSCSAFKIRPGRWFYQRNRQAILWQIEYWGGVGEKKRKEMEEKELVEVQLTKKLRC
jgi:hypothetical protein